MTSSTGAPRVRAIWTDFRGVLTPPLRDTMDAFSRRLGLTLEQLTGAMRAVGDTYGQDMMAPLDIPLVSEAEWAKQVEAALVARYGVEADLSDFGVKWFEHREINEAWLERIRRAHDAGVFVGLISNMPPEWDRHWRTMIAPEGLFDELLLSFQAGLRKPDAEIYARAEKLADAAPHECVLIDDTAVNCTGAEAVGWQAIHFTDTAAAIARLDQLLA
ncbi:HAD-IA family hydrolase [Streptomyces sp. NPDC059002]|uniref:HAD-IA family hydrolase n=1 Tax=Streptomyces sp. NPDC059002 TaxID=3346690 RepID=UPI00367CBF21